MILSTGMTLDLAARELKATMMTKVAGKTTKQVLVVAGKYVYVRLDSRAWIRKPRSTFEKSGVDMITPLRLIRDPADLKYVGAEKIDGHMRQHLTASRILPYGTLNGATGQYDKFDVWTAEDGTPVLVKIALSATAANGLKVKGTTEFRFSHFGGPIKIVAPKIAK
jgi:hypothetical protein